MESRMSPTSAPFEMRKTWFMIFPPIVKPPAADCGLTPGRLFSWLGTLVRTEIETWTATPATFQWLDVVHKPNLFVAGRFGCVDDA
jgi:hypothetical protein